MYPRLLLSASTVVLFACAPTTPAGGPVIVIADPSGVATDSVGPAPGPCTHLVIRFAPGLTQEQFKAALITALGSCR